MLGHVQLDELHAVPRVEVLIREQGLELVLGLDLVALGLLLGGSENMRQILPLPLLDVVVLGLFAVDFTLDGEAFVADAEAVSPSVNCVGGDEEGGRLTW
jgi:hypothetical protein